AVGGQVLGRPLAQLGQGVGELQHVVELGLVTPGPPGLVVEVLAAAGGVGPDRLEVPGGDGADPDVLPGRRDGEGPDPGQDLGVGDRLPGRLLVAEGPPPPPPPDARARAVDPPDPGHAAPTGCWSRRGGRRWGAVPARPGSGERRWRRPGRRRPGTAGTIGPPPGRRRRAPGRRPRRPAGPGPRRRARAAPRPGGRPGPVPRPRTSPRSRRWWWPSWSAGPGAGRRRPPGGRARSGWRRRRSPRSCRAPLPLLLGLGGLVQGEPAGGADAAGGVEGELDHVPAGRAVDLQAPGVVALAGGAGRDRAPRQEILVPAGDPGAAREALVGAGQQGV